MDQQTGKEKKKVDEHVARKPDPPQKEDEVAKIHTMLTNTLDNGRSGNNMVNWEYATLQKCSKDFRGAMALLRERYQLRRNQRYDGGGQRSDKSVVYTLMQSWARFGGLILKNPKTDEVLAALIAETDLTRDYIDEQNRKEIRVKEQAYLIHYHTAPNDALYCLLHKALCNVKSWNTDDDSSDDDSSDDNDDFYWCPYMYLSIYNNNKPRHLMVKTTSSNRSQEYDFWKQFNFIVPRVRKQEKLKKLSEDDKSIMHSIISRDLGPHRQVIDEHLFAPVNIDDLEKKLSDVFIAPLLMNLFGFNLETNDDVWDIHLHDNIKTIQPFAYSDFATTTLPGSHVPRAFAKSVDFGWKMIDTFYIVNGEVKTRLMRAVIARQTMTFSNEYAGASLVAPSLLRSCAWLACKNLAYCAGKTELAKVMETELMEDPGLYCDLRIYTGQNDRMTLQNLLHQPNIRCQLDSVVRGRSEKDKDEVNAWLEDPTISGHFLCVLQSEYGDSTHAVGVHRTCTTKEGDGVIFDDEKTHPFECSKLKDNFIPALDGAKCLHLTLVAELKFPKNVTKKRKKNRNKKERAKWKNSRAV